MSRRSIGARRGAEPGPLLLCISSLHGNEPAGIAGLQRVLAALDDGGVAMRGDLVGLRGNLAALDARTRFIDEDMNRVWQADRVEAALAALTHGARNGGPPSEGAEAREQRELLAAISEASRRARGPVTVLDLHTTSSDSAPFATAGDTELNRALASRLPVPVVLGMETQIDGALLQYFDRLGWRSLGIEGGRHDAPSSVDAHEDAVWVAMEALGLVEEGIAPGAAAGRARLARSSAGLPRVLDVRYRHEIAEEDGFRMRSGFRNFDPVEAGQLLGSDRAGPVRAPSAGRVFLPLYQAQGDDGFFIVRRGEPAWSEAEPR